VRSTEPGTEGHDALMKAPFAAWDFALAARSLAEALERHSSDAERCAHEMHRTAHGPKNVTRVNVYETTTSPRRAVTFVEAFASWGAFIDAVRASDAAALEAGLEILSRVAPTDAMPIAGEILAQKPWMEMGGTVGAALARCDDPRAVGLALVHLDVPRVTTAIGSSVCDRAASLVLARLEASPALAPAAPGDAPCDRRETMIVEALLRYLGAHRVQAAWDRIASLYAEHRDRYVRLGAGHALVAYGDARSLDLLALGLDDHDGDPRRLMFAVRALIAKHGAAVIPALGGVDALARADRRDVAAELLQQIARRATTSSGAGEPRRPPEHLGVLELALRWVNDRHVKDVCQGTIDLFDAKALAAAKAKLEGVTAGKKRRAKPAGSAAEIERVRALLEIARANLERVVLELRALGYVFRSEPPLSPREDRTATTRAIEEALGGPLPISLRLALEILGGCDLTGTFPGHPSNLESDAFVLIDGVEALDQAREEGGREAQVSLVIAPDRVGKAGFSGGQEIVLVPAATLDAQVIGVDGEPLFLDRLREVFRYGGFPGLASAGGPLAQIVARLAATLAPLPPLPPSARRKRTTKRAA
jgi:hypothetical protein